MAIEEPGPTGAEKPTALETWSTVILSLVAVVLLVLECTLRAIRGEGIPGGFKYVQHCMVWLGFIGAVIATGSGHHLGLATTNFLEAGRFRRFAIGYTTFVAAAVCTVLTYASYHVVKENAQGTDMLAGNIPAWYSELILPLSMAILALRFAWRAPGGWRGRLATVVGCGLIALLLWKTGQREGGIPTSLFYLLLIGLLAAFVLGAPVFTVMGGIAMLLFFRESSPIASVPQETMRLASNEALPAIPLLTLMGFILAAGGSSQRLVRAYKSLFGWLPGGVALMVIGVCALFTTFTGGSGVTILALGGIMLPALTRDGYPQGFSQGLVTASGSLGLLFPPSLPVILYSVTGGTGVSANALFLGGLVPGVLLLIVVGAYAIRTGIVARAPRQKFELGEAGRALWAAKLDLLLPILVLTVFLMGWTTIVEAAAIGTAYALLVQLVVFREVHPWKELPAVMAESATLVGAVIILMGMALGFTNYLVDAQIGEALTDWAQAHIHAQWVFLLALNGMLLVLGSVFEIYAAIIVLAPLVAPLGDVFHVDKVHLGVVFLANLELGFLFPPMGLNLFLAASRFKKPLPSLYRQALPFLAILAVGVLVITYVPAMTTGVARLLGTSRP